jgi:RNA polymerase sigma-54 factor
MAAQMSFELAPRQAMQMRPSAMLVGFADMLALPSAEMERAVAQELEDNPALERVEAGVCGFCGGRAGACPVCGPVPGDRGGRPARGTTQRPDAAASLACEERPEDVLLREVATVLPRRERSLAEFVIESLDGRGFLGETPADLAEHAGVAPDRVLRIIAALRDICHPGIAAADLRDSLLLQLDSLQAADPVAAAAAPEAGQVTVELVRRIVAGHLTGLGQGRFPAIARALGITVNEVREARAFIQRELCPSPVERICADTWASPRRIPALPDLIVTERAGRPGHYAVELAEAIRCAVRVDPAWQAAAMDAPPGDGSSVRELVSKASGFLVKLERRWSTLRMIGAHLADRQREFIRSGPSSLVALTRAQVARDLGLSESTVSRAVAGKFALLPSGKVVPLADFFDCSLQVRTELAAIVTAESRPLSDSELADLLRCRGYDVARRTVAKYRDRLGILPAGLR